ncbi:MAG: Crp/Fnr family transcriptional regulator [Burkholderiales bacterium]
MSAVQKGAKANHATVPQNRLLAALPRASFHSISRHLEPVTFKRGEVVQAPGKPVQYAYFPVTSIVSMMYRLENGDSAEIGMVGRDGVVGGIPLIMGGDSCPCHAVAHTAGTAWKMGRKAFLTEFVPGNAFHVLLLRYTQALLLLMTQSAVCARLHTLEQQLCRWLLFTLDRMNGDELLMTHETIAGMLGVRREVITLAAQRLQDAGCIRYSRGRMRILERKKLETRCCECYQVVKKEYTRLLS